MSTIVVGVDGSEGSLRALDYALAEAKLRGADVKAVGAWHVPAIVYEAGWVPASIDLGEYPRCAQAAIDTALTETGAASSGIEVTSVVSKGQAADILCQEAQGAALLVVGSRGRGGFKGLMLGSVSQQCAQHAPCPLTIIPADDAD